MSVYRHRQIGTLILSTLGACVIVSVVILMLVADRGGGGAGPFASVVVVGLALMLLFGTLTVEVSRERIRLWFSVGWIRKSFEIGDVRDARTVRNCWYYGWGIRLTPHGWLFSVSGLDAVEIETTLGKTYRIGTDQPRELLSAIRHAMEENRRG